MPLTLTDDAADNGEDDDDDGTHTAHIRPIY